VARGQGKSLLLLSGVAVLVSTGCTLRPGEGQFVCHDETECPKGWDCREGRCYSGNGNGSDTDEDTGSGSSRPSDTGTGNDTGTGSGSEPENPTDTDMPKDSETDTLTDTPTETEATTDTDTPKDSDTPQDTGSSVDTGTETASSRETDTPPETDSAPDTETLTATESSTEDAGVIVETDCECDPDEGVCCAPNCMFYTAGDRHVCGETVVLTCGSANCGGSIRSRRAEIMCSGVSSQCGDGLVVATGQPETVAICLETQKCVKEEGSDPECVEDPACL
jgi:hypothetical protein